MLFRESWGCGDVTNQQILTYGKYILHRINATCLIALKKLDKYLKKHIKVNILMMTQDISALLNERSSYCTSSEFKIMFQRTFLCSVDIDV